MRRNYISPEYEYVKRNGSMNMIEQTSFFGSKMIDISDLLFISNENIIYYQSANKEQLNFSLENGLSPILYSSFDDKKNNHSIKIDESQNSIQYESNTKWIITIDVKKILINYLFATLKKYRTFEGIKNNMTIYNNVDTAIYEYISKNILNRYRYKSIDFFVDYVSFLSDGSMRYKNTFLEITNSPNITNKIQVMVSDNQETVTLIFNQEKPSGLYNYNYYFNLHFEKI